MLLQPRAGKRLRGGDLGIGHQIFDDDSAGPGGLADHWGGDREPHMGACEILCNAFALDIQKCQFLLGAGQALFGGKFVPIGGGPLVLADAASVCIHAT